MSVGHPLARAPVEVSCDASQPRCNGHDAQAWEGCLDRCDRADVRRMLRVSRDDRHLHEPETAAIDAVERRRMPHTTSPRGSGAGVAPERIAHLQRTTGTAAS